MLAGIMVLARIFLSSKVSARTRISGRVLSMMVCRLATLSFFLSERQLMLTNLSGLKEVLRFLFFLRELLLRGMGSAGEKVPWGGPGLKRSGLSAMVSESAEKLL